jgi:hypothetical protein
VGLTRDTLVEHARSVVKIHIQLADYLGGVVVLQSNLWAY